jgi:hypothetical protein
VDLEYLKIIVKKFEILELGLLDLVFSKNQLFQQDLPKHELWISYGVISNILLSSASKVQMCSFGDEPITPKKNVSKLLHFKEVSQTLHTSMCYVSFVIYLVMYIPCCLCVCSIQTNFMHVNFSHMIQFHPYEKV